MARKNKQQIQAEHIEALGVEIEQVNAGLLLKKLAGAHITPLDLRPLLMLQGRLRKLMSEAM